MTGRIPESFEGLGEDFKFYSETREGFEQGSDGLEDVLLGCWQRNRRPIRKCLPKYRMS